MTATVESLTADARSEASELGLVNPLSVLPSEVGFPDWFARVEENFRRVSVAECRAVFRHYLGEAAGELDRFRECKAVYCFDELVERHCQAHLDDLSGLLHRRVELFLGHLQQFRVAGHPQTAELQSAIEQEFYRFRGRVGEADLGFGQLNQLVKNAPARADRQAAWETFIPLGNQCRAQLLELVAARNRQAVALGYRDFIDMRWRRSDIDETWMLGLLDRIEAATQAPYEAACAELRANLGLERLEAWDIAFGVERVSPLPPESFDQAGARSRLHRMLEGWGFSPDELDIPIAESNNFPMGGLCFGIEPGREVAILISPVNGARYYRGYFHEHGHALHFRHAGQNNILLNEEDMVFNEGMAVFFESFVSDPDWVRENLALDPDEAERFCRQGRYAALTWIRTLVANIRFEHALYSQPDQDPDATYRALVQRLNGYTLPADASARWAADQMLVSMPIYYHNYLIAELITRQTREALLGRDGALLGNPNVRTFLMEQYYRPGASLPWPEKIRRATGRSLDGEAFFRYLARN